MGKARAPFRLRQVLHSGLLGALRLHHVSSTPSPSSTSAAAPGKQTDACILRRPWGAMRAGQDAGQARARPGRVRERLKGRRGSGG